MSTQRVAGFEWQRKSDGAILRVMAFADGYVMLRIPGCVPFVISFKELQRDYKLSGSGEKE